MIEIKAVLTQTLDAVPPAVQLVTRLCAEALLDERPGALLHGHFVHVLEVFKAPGLGGEYVVELSKLEMPQVVGDDNRVEHLIRSAVDTRVRPRPRDHAYQATVLLSNGMELPREVLLAPEEGLAERVAQQIAEGAARQVLRALSVGPGGHRVFAWRVPGQPDVGGQVVGPGEEWPESHHPLIGMVTGLHEKLSSL